MLAARTEREYRWYVRRWEAAGEPEPKRWVESFEGSHQRTNARAALVWWHRVELGVTLRLDQVSATRKIPEAFTEPQLEVVLQAAVVSSSSSRPW
jgi:hypothetical protein